MARKRGGRPAGPVAGLTAVLLGGALAACSGSPSGAAGASAPASGVGPAGTASTAPAASPAPSVAAAASLQDASADEILAQARDALYGARTVHAKGTFAAGGATYALDLQLVRDTGAVGSLATGGATTRVVRIGSTAYIQLDPASWRAATGSDEAARQFAGKYLRVTSATGSAFRPFLQLTDAKQTYDAVLAPSGTVTKGGTTTIGGIRAVDLLVDGGSTGHVWVALQGPPYPLRVSYGRGGAQRVDFDRFAAPVTLKAPPAAQVKDVPRS